MFLEFPKKSILLKFSHFKERGSAGLKFMGRHHRYIILVYFILTFFLRRKLYEAEIEMTKVH